MKETIYNDFVTKMLPKVQEGLMITKEYFTDLFGRYVKCLIITDSLILALCVVMFFVGCFAIYKHIKWVYSDDYDDDSYRCTLGALIPGILITFSVPGLFINTSNLVKDFYIPEIRVHEQFKSIGNLK